MFLRGCRDAVDFGIALFNEPRTAQLFVRALAAKIPQGGLQPYSEGDIPSEVKVSTPSNLIACIVC
jgi:carbamoyl-phosphate synthase large subunit